nr:MAG TPA: hypothetical protein [Caudoviricetes sp.]
MKQPVKFPFQTTWEYLLSQQWIFSGSVYISNNRIYVLISQLS